MQNLDEQAFIDNLGILNILNAFTMLVSYSLELTRSRLITFKT